MYPVFSTSLFLLILGTTSFPGTLNFIGELFNMISLSIVDVVFNGLFVTSIPLTTSYSLFLFKRSCGNIYLNYRNQTMDVSRLYLWIPSAALFPLTATHLTYREVPSLTRTITIILISSILNQRSPRTGLVSKCVTWVVIHGQVLCLSRTLSNIDLQANTAIPIMLGRV